MSNLADKRLKICERHYTREGQPFSIVGREWVRDELFVPASSWRLWPRDPQKLCAKCAARAGSFVDWSSQLLGQLQRHAKEQKCAGLRLLPVMVILENIQRGAGKTTNASALLISMLVTEPGLTAGFFASAGTQTRTLLREYFHTPIDHDPELHRALTIVGDRIECPAKRSWLEATDTSHRSVTGRRRRVIYIEEARDIDGRTFSAVLPSIRAQLKFACLNRHATAPYDENHIPTCSVCRKLMTPIVPRIIICSTSGMQDGGDRDWFDQLVQSLEDEPKPWAHLYRDTEAKNPSAASQEKDMLQDVFGGVPGLSDYLEVELHNTSRRKGDDFVSTDRFRQVVDPRLTFLDGSLDPCYAFLDTSLSKELTSLVIVGDHPERKAPLWTYLRLMRADYWDPAQSNGVIDEKAVEAHIIRIAPLFPALRELAIDCRGGMAWAADLAQRLRRIPGWGHKVIPFYGSRGSQQTRDRQDAWTLWESRILAGTYRQPPQALIEKEVLGVRRVTRADGTWEIRDRSRKKRHADLIEGIAECCRKIYLEQTRPKASFAGLSIGASMDRALSDAFAPITKNLARSIL